MPTKLPLNAMEIVGSGIQDQVCVLGDLLSWYDWKEIFKITSRTPVCNSTPRKIVSGYVSMAEADHKFNLKNTTVITV